MENENRRTGLGLIILIICLAIGAIGYVGYLTYQDIQDHREFLKQWAIDSQVDVQRLNDSTYHVNLGDGSACFTIEKFQDSLSMTGVNLVMAILDRDTLTVMSTGSSAVWKHVYEFAYHDFFEDSIPDRSKVSFNLN